MTMTTVILTWTRDPLSFKVALDGDIAAREYGAIQRELIPVLRSIPNLTFSYKEARFEIAEADRTIPFMVQALSIAGYAILHKGDVPAEIEQAERPN
ncbi:hypothetical protein B5E41_30025 [Rhizobium esperanzae]|uniref:Uncharacterized protein n=1 Tax=Rhizobium esperanzae TaxID=1967781 RepID=A0A246DKQ5_9HYPH|nr:hypothetical protein [Rhizobium esperanzae]OWO89719.1 hypothetical protein B5E41_30025 [Rhizobium esperanzae]